MGAAELIVLPSTVADGRPQFLLNDGGIWRDVTRADTFSAAEFRKRAESLLNTAMQQVSIGNSVSPTGAGFVGQCKTLYQSIVPSEVRDEVERMVKTGPTPLLKIYLHPSADWIPWELLHDGTDYLALQMSLVRLPLMLQTAHMRGNAQRDVRSVHSLLGRGVLSDAALPDWEQTFAGLGNGAGWETRCPVAANSAFASLDELTSASAADIVHITCHGGLTDGQGPYFWSLDHTSALTFNYRIAAEDLLNVSFTQRPLVFGNACSSVAAGPGANPGGLHGFGASFMRSGALNFIGTFAPITQQTAVKFAAAFYKHLLAAAPAQSIAAALLETKREFAVPTASDPSFLFYCLYGPPDTSYRTAH
jgi:CHAT domain-containing protein